MNRRRAQAFHSFFQNEASDESILGLCPNNKYVSNRAVGNPDLISSEQIPPIHFYGTTRHAARIGPVVGLGKAKTANKLAACQARKVLTLLLFRAKLENWHHHQRGLHTHHRAIARIYILHLARHQTICNVIKPRATILFRDSHTQEPQRPHLLEYFDIRMLISEGIQNSWSELLLSILMRCFADHPLFLCELAIQQKRTRPVEFGLIRSHSIYPLRRLP